jgi:hypothetical protein
MCLVACLLAGTLGFTPVTVLAQSPQFTASPRLSTQGANPTARQGIQAKKQNSIILPDDRLVVGVVERVEDNQVTVNTGQLMPRYLPLKEAVQNRTRPLIRGDFVEIWVNDQDVLVDYHPLDTLGWHQMIRGILVQPLAVNQEWAVIRREKGRDRREQHTEEAYAVRPLARSKVAAIPVGSPALFLVDRANKIIDATFGSEETLQRAAKGWLGSPPKAVEQEIAGTILKPMSANTVTIQQSDGIRQTFEVRPFLQDKLRKIPPGKNVTLLIDDENKVMDVAIPRY